MFTLLPFQSRCRLGNIRSLYTLQEIRQIPKSKNRRQWLLNLKYVMRSNRYPTVSTCNMNASLFHLSYLHLFLNLKIFWHVDHPWIREGGEASDKPIDSAVLSRMKQFRAMNKLKKLALKVYCNDPLRYHCIFALINY